MESFGRAVLERDGGIVKDLAAVAALVHRDTPRMGRIIAGAAVAQSAYEVFQDFVDRRRERRRYTVSISETDDLFDAVSKEVFARAENLGAPNAQRIKSRRRNDRIEMSVLHADGAFAAFEIDGHRVVATTTRTSPTRSASSVDPVSDSEQAGESLFTSFTPLSLIFTCGSEAARESVVSLVGDIARRGVDKKPRIHTATETWWNARPLRGRRSADTLVLADGQMETLLTDVEKFLSSEEEYARWGTPWHRGYLFYGPPGTGKTSLARVVASHFNLNIYYISINSIKTDSALLSLVRDIEPDSILVLEDVDVFHAARNRDDSEAGVSLAGLLNALDGIATPEGIITVMTTNNKDVLDPALLRPGRIDVSMQIDFVSGEQVTRMCKTFLGLDVISVLVEDKVPAAAVMETLRHNIGKPQSVVESELMHLLESKKSACDSNS